LPAKSPTSESRPAACQGQRHDSAGPGRGSWPSAGTSGSGRAPSRSGAARGVYVSGLIVLHRK
jgi:hypothetical protein